MRVREATAADLPRLVELLADDPLGRQRERLETPLPASYHQAFADIDGDPNHRNLNSPTIHRAGVTCNLTTHPL